MAYNYKKGKFTPINKEKYVGDVNNIVYRSGWEKSFCKYCDLNPAILFWQSEETIIPYVCETDGRIHRYHIDFTINMKASDGTTKTLLIEIKPFAQTQEPKKRSRKTRKYLNEVMTYVKNQSKWREAEAFAKKNNAEFKVLTEKDLKSIINK